jgi:hypothetical protein
LGQWDSIYEDVYPEQFHKFMQAELFEKRQPFIIDYDAGIEVWNVPAYRASVEIKAEPTNKYLLHVTTWLFTADAQVDDFNFIGTKEIIREYTYDLYGYPQNDGSFLVKHGVWTDRSRMDHPDYLIPKPSFISRKSKNTEIDPYLVDLITK